jgi:hypothetical protein
VLALSLTASAWLSLLPYFLWTHRQIALASGGALAGLMAASVLWTRRREAWARRDWLTALGLVAFLTYISAQKTVAGGHALWIFVVPTVAAVFVARQRERRVAYHAFEFLFILSLIPGLVMLCLMIAGVPLTFAVRPPPNALFAANGIRMLQGFGAVFIENNSQVLPWGGFISRLCGMYDEPGMVGTMAALLLAARGFDIRGWRAILLWISGLLSLSLAFILLALIGHLFGVVVRREWKSALLAIPVVAAALFTLGIARPAPPAKPVAPSVKVTSAPGVTAPIKTEGSEIRQTKAINNRSLPEMTALVRRYEASSWHTIVFGMASDASVIYGGASAVWTRILTNHGVLGFTLLTAAFVGYGLTAIPRAGHPLTMVLFLASFALSFYQRPVIWMPYTLLLFFGGLAVLEAVATTDRSTPLEK